MKETKRNIFIINIIITTAFLIVIAGTYTIDKHMFKYTSTTMQITETLNN